MEYANKKSEKENRIRAITKLYYSNPKVQEALLKFSADREVVPRYYEGFGKRPDSLMYPSDIIGLVNKGATSFHASEELWLDPLKIDSEMSPEELAEIRKAWDLLIDIDSPYLDLSKIAARLVIKALEYFGIKNYGIKYSGSKGFHIIVSGRAFPKEYGEKQMKDSFPEWPRAITEYLMDFIRAEYDLEFGKISSSSEIEKRKDGKERPKRIYCTQCNKPAINGCVAKFKCPVCNLEIERKNIKLTKRRLRCLNNKCPGVFDVLESKEFYYCENCKDPENDKLQLSMDKHPDYFKEMKGEDAEKHGKFDLVLVAPRHLFRMPYSLHEKTALASIVLKKEEIENFNPRDADPLKVKIRDYLPDNNEDGEAKKLLAAALEWKKNKESIDEKIAGQKYKSGDYAKVDFTGVTEQMFPMPIKKLLKGLKDGKKRGLFILLTFFKSLGFSAEYINNKVREWNKLNEPPLKEGYLKSQVDWHLKQKKQILPPNYSNDAFYSDLGLLDKKPEVKNPIVDVMRALRK